MTDLIAYTCHWCGEKTETPWRSPQQPLDRCPHCGQVMVQENLPKAREQSHYGQEEHDEGHA